MTSYNFQFVLPLNREDLRRSSSNVQFAVTDVHSPGELPTKVKESQQCFKSRGPEFIFDEFNTFYSVLCYFEKVSQELRVMSWKIVLKAVTALGNELTLLFDDSDNIEVESRKKYHNMTNMLVYILCQFLESFENEYTRSSNEFVVPGAKGRKKKSQKNVYEDLDWEMEKEKGINSLYNLCQMPLQKFCQPPIIEEDFINLLRNCAFKLLENSAIVKNKTLNESVMNFLGSLLKKYGYSLGCTLKIIQHLQNYEHSSSLLAAGVEQFLNEHCMKNIVCEILREIGRIDIKDLSRDSAGTRTLSQFIIELAERVPSAVLSSISLLLSFLDCEAYTMRNCVLSVMGEIVFKVLSSENLEEKNRTLRDQLLDKLEDHIHDVNAFVRSKTIQIWTKLCSEKVIPLSRQQTLLPLVIGRLWDKSSNVRKNAIQFLTAFLKGNPFAAKLSLQELNASLEKEQGNLKDMLAANKNTPDSSLLMKWEIIEPVLKKLLANVEEGEEENQSHDDILDDDSFYKVLQEIKGYLENANYEDALKLMEVARNKWPDAEVFASITKEIDNEDPLSVDEITDAEKKLRVLKCIFFGAEGTSLPVEMNMANFQKEFNLQNDAANINEIDVNNIIKQQILVRYLQDCVRFAQELQKALPMVAQLLSSKSSSDVLEAVEFFVTAFEFGVHDSIVGVRKMLLHVWSKEAAIKDAIVSAYKRLYLNSARGGQRVKASDIVSNLTHLICGASVGELNSIEKLIGEFVKSCDFSASIYQVLWERFSMPQGVSNEESHGALLLLGMAASEEPGIIFSNLDLLVSEGLGPRGKENLKIAKDTCTALLKIVGSSKPSIEAKDSPLHYSQDHAIFTHLSDIIISAFTQLEGLSWIPLIEQAVPVIYKLAEHPDLIVGNIIKQLAKSLTGISAETEVGGGESIFSSRLLTRLIHLVGQTCLCQLVYLDVDIFTEMKRRQNIQEMKEEKRKKKNRRRSALIVSTKNSEETSDTINMEMGMKGNVADDAEAEFITKVCDTELLNGNQILGIFAPLVVSVCSDPTKYCSPSLRASTSLTLAKLMLVNSAFCEAQLPLLITVMEKSAEPVIRANIIILLGDLSYRFPNLIEPWTSHLYGRLRDSSIQVRKNTLSVLSHLILNDMIKVKGQISDIALCLVDKEECISALAKTFFHELAKKGNAVYNILPDVISRLSDPDCGTEEDNFRLVLKYLLSFIEKDRQLECLVEKLCQRFNSARVERQSRDLAYCLSLLPFNERCMRKLQENLSCFAEKLVHDDIFQNFNSIIATAKKSTTFKPELKVILEELEKAFEHYHEKGVTDENIFFMSKKALASSQTPARTRGKGKGAATPRTGKLTKRRKPVRGEMGSDLDEFKGSPEGPIRKSARKKKMPTIVFSSDSEEEVKSDIENENPRASRPTRSSRRLKS